MKFNNKYYKLKKTKQYFKNEPLFLIYASTNLNSKNTLKLQQKLKKNNLKSLTIKNQLAKKFINDSIFKKVLSLITGSICFIKLNEKTLQENFEILTNLDSSLTLIGLKITNKIYSINQLKNIQTLNYTKNINVLAKTLNKLTKLPYYKFKKT